WLVRAKWSRAVFFAAAYYVVSLFPVLGFFDVFFFRYSFVSDHFQYLASMGLLALAGAAITTGCTGLAVAVSLRRGAPTASLSSDATTLQQPPSQGFGAPSSDVPTTSLLGVCGVLLLSLAFLTWGQTAIYRDLVALYTSTLTKNPGCWMAHYILGIVLDDRERTARE